MHGRNMAAGVPTLPCLRHQQHPAPAKPAHSDGSRCCQQLFSNTQIFVPLLYLFPTIIPFFRSCISILFHSSSLLFSPFHLSPLFYPSLPHQPPFLLVCSTRQLASSPRDSSLFPSLQQDDYIKSYANISSVIMPDKNQVEEIQTYGSWVKANEYLAINKYDRVGSCIKLMRHHNAMRKKRQLVLPPDMTI